ncbi:MAG: monovalent cation/H+ antiporter subunit D family protein [Abyssibacter sp.]|nr:proton-conducting transporter membrane subunit [Abyssibacter sp.]MCK5859330.1 monovalent cation/H+ antiporter subunit D family protein [Abyssibacter sp.]
MNVVIVALAIPLLTALAVAFAGRSPALRNAVTLIGGGLLAVVVFGAWPTVIGGDRPTWEAWAILPGIELLFVLEPLGLLYASVAAGLWPITSVYAAGYLEGAGEKHRTRFFVCFALAIFAAMGIALAGNLVTLFLFYEVLTLSTWPLVTHKGTAEARRGGRIYLGILITTSVGLLLPAIVWAGLLAGTTEFRAGGILTGKASPAVLAVLYALFLFGLGKAALMPFHRWLPAAMVAPTPVSALLHAVAVVKAGVFAVLKVSVMIFGLDNLDQTDASEIMQWVAGFTILMASIIALQQDNLKARLAYSTISQLSYIVLGATMATSLAAQGAGLHIVMHALGKITLFFCAGAIYVAHHKTLVSELDGLGRKMPWTFAAFGLASLSIIGIPPLGGTWSKWWLTLGALEAEQYWIVATLAISSLLNIAYLLPIVARGFLRPSAEPPHAGAPQDHGHHDGEAAATMVAPLMLTAVGCLAAFVLAEPAIRLLQGAIP